MAATTDRLRHDIDSGRTGDKVRGSDPAMAPLGTDEEAAGTPVRPRDIETARRAEMRPPREDSRESHATWLTIAGVAAVLAIAVLSAVALH
jgi:hypothetical protein